MPKPIVWSPLAEIDIENILAYLNYNWNEQVVVKFIHLLQEKLKFITLHPSQFPSVHISKNIRKCILTKHNTIIYRVSKNEIEIVRIFDTRQDPKKLKV